MSTMEREVKLPMDSSCVGCAERDLEIERLLELKRKLISKQITARSICMMAMGWLMLGLATLGILIAFIKAAEAPSGWIEYVGIGGYLACLIIQFAFIPSLLLIHSRSGLFRFILSLATIVSMFGLWLIVGYFQSDLVVLSEDVPEAIYALPIAIISCMLPMYLMKLWGRWKLVSNPDEGQANDPSIASIFAMTALVALGIASLTHLKGSDYGTGKTAESVFLFLFYLAIPGLTVGSVLAASCYAVLGQDRSALKIIVSFASIVILFCLVVPVTLSIIGLLVLENETIDSEFWLLMINQSIGPLIVGILMALPTAIWVRQMGYRLWTRASKTQAGFSSMGGN